MIIDNGRTPLFLAVENGHKANVELLDTGALGSIDVNSPRDRTVNGFVNDLYLQPQISMHDVADLTDLAKMPRTAKEW